MRWPPLWGAATHHFLPINYLSTRCSPVPCSLRSVHPSILALTLHSLVHAVQCWNMLQWSTDLPPFSPLLFSVKSNIFFHSCWSIFSPRSHPSISRCFSSEAHCLHFAVQANSTDDLLLHPWRYFLSLISICLTTSCIPPLLPFTLLICPSFLCLSFLS